MRTRTTHELKTWPQYYDLVVRGIKPFEVRRDDRDFQAGDRVVLREWDPDSSAYTGHQVRATIGYVLRGAEAKWAGLKSGYCVFPLFNVRANHGTDDTGVELIAAERRRQVEQEGWTPRHDDQHISSGSSSSGRHGSGRIRWLWRHWRPGL